jgi:hypothetical protein
MLFKRIKTPDIAHVAYLIGAQGSVVVIDPRRDIDEYLTIARDNKPTIRYIVETSGGFCSRFPGTGPSHGRKNREWLP